MITTNSENLYNEAQKFMPGGVNSPVRACRSVGRTPLFIDKAKGSYIYDVDGNKYIDYICSWGPNILGHCREEVINAVKATCDKGLTFGACHKGEITLAKLIQKHFPSMEMLRLVNSGTEAVMSAIRAARGYTGKDKIIKFEGCYHGHSDGLLVKGGSGLLTNSIPNSAGVPKGYTDTTLLAKYNDENSVEELFNANKDEIACVIVEPCAANMGVVPPKEVFLQFLRDITKKNNALLIFDEVITGFRLQLDGAVGHFGIMPDMVTYGKIIGGGMPVGAYGGRREIMQLVAPLGSVYQAGTLSGNPVAMRAGLTQLRYLQAHPEVYHQVGFLSHRLRSGLEDIIRRHHAPCTVNGIGSLSCLYFTPEKVRNYADAKKADTAKFREYFHFMLDRGNYFGPSQFEAIFVSNAHTLREIDKTLGDADEFFAAHSGN